MKINLSLHKNFLKLSNLLFRFLWILILLLTITTTVSAHSELVKSEPEAGAILENSPVQVSAWFSQEMDSLTSNMRVFDTQNRQVDNGDGRVDLNDLDHLSMVVSLPPLQSGTYTVHWVSVSDEDGDAEEGEFTFSVTSGTGPVETSAPLVGTSLVWVIGIATVILIVAVLAMFGISRYKGSS